MALPRLPVLKSTASTGVAPAAKTSSPSLKAPKMAALKSLTTVKSPGATKGFKSPKLSMKGIKSPKAPNTSGMKSTLKSILSAAKKGGGGPSGLGLPNPAVGAPASAPSPSFFGQSPIGM